MYLVTQQKSHTYYQICLSNKLSLYNSLQEVIKILLLYKSKISQEQNRFLSRETSFCHLSNMASSGLKKMLI